MGNRIRNLYIVCWKFRFKRVSYAIVVVLASQLIAGPGVSGVSGGGAGTHRVQQALRGGRHDVQRRVHVVGVLAHVQHDALAQRRRGRARALAQHHLQLQRVFPVAVRR